MRGSGTDEKRAAPSTPAALATGLILAGLALELWGATPLNAQAQSEAMTYEGKPHRFTLTLPAGCRHEQGPGTLDAVCAPDLDPERHVPVHGRVGTHAEFLSIVGNGGTRAN